MFFQKQNAGLTESFHSVWRSELDASKVFCQYLVREYKITMAYWDKAVKKLIPIFREKNAVQCLSITL